MSLERFKYLGQTYFFDPTKPDFYLYDKENVCHIIIYTVRNYGTAQYTAEWKIPGTCDRDITYTRRMALKLPPWNVEELKK